MRAFLLRAWAGFYALTAGQKLLDEDSQRYALPLEDYPQVHPVKEKPTEIAPQWVWPFGQKESYSQGAILFKCKYPTKILQSVK